MGQPSVLLPAILATDSRLYARSILLRSQLLFTVNLPEFSGQPVFVSVSGPYQGIQTRTNIIVASPRKAHGRLMIEESLCLPSSSSTRCVSHCFSIQRLDGWYAMRLEASVSHHLATCQSGMGAACSKSPTHSAGSAQSSRHADRPCHVFLSSCPHYSCLARGNLSRRSC